MRPPVSTTGLARLAQGPLIRPIRALASVVTVRSVVVLVGSAGVAHISYVSSGDKRCCLPGSIVFITLQLMHSLIEQHRDEIARLCAKHGVRRLDVFGSAAADGEFDLRRSDFDFLVDFGDRPNPPDITAYLRFRDELATLLGRSVDLVSERGIRNPYVRAEIERSRERVHGA